MGGVDGCGGRGTGCDGGGGVDGEGVWGGNAGRGCKGGGKDGEGRREGPGGMGWHHSRREREGRVVRGGLSSTLRRLS